MQVLFGPPSDSVGGVAVSVLLRLCADMVGETTAMWATPQSLGDVEFLALLRGCAERVAEATAMWATPQSVGIVVCFALPKGSDWLAQALEAQPWPQVWDHSEEFCLQTRQGV